MITTKANWLTQRNLMLTGNLNDEHLDLFFKMFSTECVAKYKTIDLQTFREAFVKWFGQPISIRNGLPTINNQQGIVGALISYFDAYFNVTYLFDKNKTIIKAY